MKRNNWKITGINNSNLSNNATEITLDSGVKFKIGDVVTNFTFKEKDWIIGSFHTENGLAFAYSDDCKNYANINELKFIK